MGISSDSGHAALKAGPLFPRHQAVFEHAKMSVWVYPAEGIVHHQMHSPVLGAVFRQALTEGARAMQLHKASRWLSDDRNNGALSPADFEWVDQTWFPMALNAGWKSWALLPPASVIGQMNIQHHIKLHAERGIVVNVFSDLTAAAAWLRSV